VETFLLFIMLVSAAAVVGLSVLLRTGLRRERDAAAERVDVLRRLSGLGLVLAIGLATLTSLHAQFSFKSAVDLVNVTATVTDASGHFVPGLRAEDFMIYEDGKPQKISQFDAERAPVSLGIVLDTSGSMQGEKMSAARAAVSQFVNELGPRDEMFLYRFDHRPILVQGWTEDRRAIVRALDQAQPNGDTALYDAMAAAVPLAARGSRAKKAVVLISDGNDTNSRASVEEVRQLIRAEEVLVYAIGIDGDGPASGALPSIIRIPGGGQIQLPWPRQPSGRGSSSGSRSAANGRVNAGALRMITDDSGGRTEIITSARDLNAATLGIADEISQQYFLGYESTLPKDGRWHSIEVRTRRSGNTVRARAGYIAD